MKYSKPTKKVKIEGAKGSGMGVQRHREGQSNWHRDLDQKVTSKTPKK